MVKLTLEMMVKKPSGISKKKKDESINSFLRKLTHLNLENRNLDETGTEFSRCPNLIALYLYDNKLPSIPNLNSLNHLSSLYLQNNNLTSIENLGSLVNLKKLYLGGNAIYVMEGIEQLQQLEELHVENQRLLSGENLIFDSHSILGISNSIKILNVSGNNLNSLQPFEPCSLLVKVNASKNKLDDLEEVVDVIKQWPFILKLDFTGNPIASKNKYKDRIILATIESIDTLDGKEVSMLSKKFLKGLQVYSETRKTMPQRDEPSYHLGKKDAQKLFEVPVKQPVLAEGQNMSLSPVRERSTQMDSAVMVSCPLQNRTTHRVPLSMRYIHKKQRPNRLGHALVAPPSSSADFYDDHESVMND